MEDPGSESKHFGSIKILVLILNPAGNPVYMICVLTTNGMHFCTNSLVIAIGLIDRVVNGDRLLLMKIFPRKIEEVHCFKTLSLGEQ